MTSAEDSVKLFTLNSMLIETDLRSVQKQISEDIGHSKTNNDSDVANHLTSLPSELKAEAKAIAGHYVSFYCLENYMRQIIEELMNETYESDWWPKKIPDQLVQSAKKNRENEEKSGVTPRSEGWLNYLTFGELSEVIKHNWKGCFEQMFSDLNAVQRIMSDLNRLRGPIAHCCLLPEDEIGRLELAVKDLMRQM
jgi:hypothetical protein